MGLLLHYNFLWNILHYPCGVVPVTRVREDEQRFEDEHNDHWTKLLNKTARGSAGMPIGLQVVGHSFEDEKVLGVMQAIENKIEYKCEVKAP